MTALRDFLFIVLELCLVIFAVMAIAMTLFLPFAYFEGKAKSAYLANEGLTMPWYEAAFLPDSAFTDIRLRAKTEKPE